MLGAPCGYTIVTSASFSPDGKWIVFGNSGVGGAADIFVMRADGSGLRQLTRTRGMVLEPDGGVLVEAPGPIGYAAEHPG